MSIEWGVGYSVPYLDTQLGLPDLGGGRGLLLRPRPSIADFTGATPSVVLGTLSLDVSPAWGTYDSPRVVRLADNKVLAVGGYDTTLDSGSNSCYVLEFEGAYVSVYDAGNFPRAVHGTGLTLLADGRVLSTLAVYKDEEGYWSYEYNVVRFGTCSGRTVSWQTGSIAFQPENSWQESNATRLLLPDGRVLVSPLPWASLVGGMHPFYFVSVSGTSVSVVAAASPLAGDSAYSSVTRTTLCLLSDGRIFFGLGADSLHSYAGRTACWIGTISGSSITWEAETSFPYTQSQGFQAALPLPDNRFAVVSTVSGAVSAVIGTASAFGTPAEASFSSSGSSAANFLALPVTGASLQSAGAASAAFTGRAIAARAAQGAAATTASFVGRAVAARSFHSAGAGLFSAGGGSVFTSNTQIAGASSVTFFGVKITPAAFQSAGIASAGMVSFDFSPSAFAAVGGSAGAFAGRAIKASVAGGIAVASAAFVGRAVAARTFSADGSSTSRFFQPARGIPRSLYIYTTPNEVTVHVLR